MTSPERIIPSMGDSPLSFYESYQSRHGGLSQEAYESALTRAADLDTELYPGYASAAESMAVFSGIELSPETRTLYAILRSDKIKNSEADHYTDMDDQPLLAEILYREGKHEDLSKFVRAYPNIFKQK